MHPIIAKLGPFTIYSYGMMVAIAFLAGLHIARIEARRKGLDINIVYDFVFYLIIGSLIGARLYYLAFFNPSIFIKDPVSVLKLWEGGLAIHGALLGGTLSAILFSRIRRTSFWGLADLTAPSMILGQAIGRIGCFLNGCCSGKLWPAYNIFYPTQIFSSFIMLLVFLGLRIIGRRNPAAGNIFILYLICYSTKRFFIEFLRVDSPVVFFGITIFQLISLVIFSVALFLYFTRLLRPARD